MPLDQQQEITPEQRQQVAEAFPPEAAFDIMVLFAKYRAKQATIADMQAIVDATRKLTTIVPPDENVTNELAELEDYIAHLKAETGLSGDAD